MKNKDSRVRPVVKGTLHAVIATLLLVLLFALVVRFAGIGGGAITAIMQIIKVVSIFYGVRVTLRSIEKKGYLFGALVGLLYTVLSFFIFSIIDSNFSITIGLLNDLIFCTILGATSAFVIMAGRGRSA